MSEPQEPQVIAKKGGRPPQPDAPTNAADCRTLLAAEIVKRKPDQTCVRGLQALLENFERLETREANDTAARLTQSIADNASLQIANEELRGTVTTLTARCESLAVPHNAVETANTERDAMRRDIESATTKKEQAVKEMQEAVKARDLALNAQRTAEQDSIAFRRQLDSEYMKMIGPMMAALSALPPPDHSNVAAQEQRYKFESLLTEFRRLHAQAIATAVPLTPSVPPVKSTKPLTPEELEAQRKKREKVYADKVEADRVENAAQPRSVDPSAYEPGRERHVPRYSEPAPHIPISGGADWSGWVK